jgi:predicted DsbA family dithiol-disulfide isomerase
VAETTKSHAELIAGKYRMSVAQAQTMIDRMVATAAADGLDFQFDQIKRGNTFDAHRLVHLAGERGKQDAMKERLMRAYLTEGRAIGEKAVLAELAIDIGLDATEVNELLAGDRFAAEVRADEGMARELDISGVPFFVVDGRLGVSGAQTADVLRSVLEQGFRDRDARGEANVAGASAATADVGACGPDGCALPA